MSNELLIAYSLKATVILIAALGLCLILRRASAAARHVVWTVAFAALLLLPILSRVTPAWTAPVRASSAPRITAAVAVRPVARPARTPLDSIPRARPLGPPLVLARHDWLALTMAELAVALCWFHPLAWWVASRMRGERERACDDRVLAAGVGASGYAADLLEVARGLGSAKDNRLPAPAMARASN